MSFWVSMGYISQMELYTLVSLEISGQDKAPVVMYITIGGTYINSPSNEDLFIAAQRYVNDSKLTYKLLNVTHLTKEQYNSFLQGQIADFLRTK